MEARRTAAKRTAAARQAAPGQEEAARGQSDAVEEESAEAPASEKDKPDGKAASRTRKTTGGTPTEKAAARKTTAKKAAAKKATAKKTTAKKTTAKKAPAKKTTGKKTATKKTARKAPAEETAAGGSTTKKATAKKAAASRTTAKQTPAGKTSGSGKSAAKKTGAQTVAAKKTPAAKTTAVPTARTAQTTPAEPGDLAVRPGEDPWTEEEVADARTELQSEAVRLHAEIASSEQALTGLMRDSGDGAGDDDADTGTKNITREHEMALAANAREMVYQTERALERLEAGTYGLCENCGNAIGKARMQAFPRATLCVDCKQKQERR
ncbi:TraR/DksA family transcriptional regulator [Streptomyces oceani]|uniref:DNA-binding protein n=1 Tax=Streptomyces oceani TaxID=1075402 RepID=A0A1E7JZE5_9ACTN|nr:TraR/DksA C4-type zinc finger protein [Streptomyces oceani]OEU97073.1 DNA-binding protein [Streptomyces oceani]